MKRVILLCLILISFVGYSQVETIEIIEVIEVKDKDSRLVIDPYTSDEQRDEEANDPKQIYSIVEKMPEYPDGGTSGFRKYIAKKFRKPKIDKDLKGLIIVRFVIEPDGKISNVRVERDLGYGTGKEAVRVISNSKKWIPGVQDGKKVRVNYTIPIMLNIEATKK